jgi:hypothetical protein
MSLLPAWLFLTHTGTHIPLLSVPATVDSEEQMYSETFCSSLLNKMVPYNYQLPDQCTKYRGVNERFQRMKSEAQENNAVAFAGMSPGEACDAQVARAHGRINHAQIKRRMTTQSKKSQSSWF